MTPGTRDQLTLPFGTRELGPPPFRPSASQRDALLRLRAFSRRVQDAPSGLTAIILVGPQGSGKTRLVHEAQRDSLEPLQGAVVPAEEYRALDLFADINCAAAAREVLVLEARRPPERWFPGDDSVPPDLFSRLDASPIVPLDRPGPESLLPALTADIAMHGQRVTDEEARFVAELLPRDFSSPRRFCQALEMAGPSRSRRQLLQWAAEKAHVAAP